MGGQSSATTDTSQSQQGTTSALTNQSQIQNGSTSSSTNPWAAAMPTVQGILDKLNPLVSNSGINSTQQSGIDQLIANASNGNQFASGINSTASNLLSGGGATAQSGNITGALDDLKSRLSSYANGLQIGNNPGLKAQLDQAATDTSNSINGQFASAGRDMSGANQQAVARGVTAAQAPIIANQYNQDISNQMGAASTLYGAGNTTSGLLAALTQQGLTNQQQGITAAGQAVDASNYGANQLLNAGNLQSSIPTQMLSLLAQIGIPIAGLGQSSSGMTNQSGTGSSSSSGQSSTQGTGTSTTTNNPSWIQDLQGLGSAYSSFFPAKK